MPRLRGSDARLYAAAGGDSFSDVPSGTRRNNAIPGSLYSCTVVWPVPVCRLGLSVTNIVHSIPMFSI